MKNYISISLFIFWAVLVSILTAGLVFNNNQVTAPLANNNQTGSTTGNTVKSDTTGSTKTQVKTVIPPVTITTGAVPPASTGPVTVPPANKPITLSPTEIAKHNTQANCWLLINNGVYDVTSYLRAHPGGVSTITPYCGKEATQAFDSRGGTGTHSGGANSLLRDYLIGQLNQTVSASQAPVLSTNTPATISGEYEDGEDD